MRAWIIYYQDSAIYNQTYIGFYIEEGRKLGIDVKLILVEELEFGVENNQWFIRYQGRKLPKPEFAINRAIYPLLSKQLESLGIKVFNNSFVAELCNDKAKTYQYLANYKIPMVASSFYKKEQIREVIFNLKQPSVLKAVDGHGGSQVFLIEPNAYPNEDMIQEIVNKMGGSDVVVQPLIGKRNQDLRVYVIGKEIVACVLRTAKEGFKSNFSLGGEVILYQLSEDEKKLVKVIIEQFEFGLVGIDFMIGDEGELNFNEIEDIVGARMLYQCSDKINIVELYLSYIVHSLMKVKPQDTHISHIRCSDNFDTCS